MSLVLLVDDDEDMLLMTGRWLERAGYEVAKAASGEEALGLLNDRRPDLILLDYTMPGMDGPAVLEAIRSDASNKDIPVLYRTGMDDINICREPAPDGIVPKSEGKAFLINAIEKALG